MLGAYAKKQEPAEDIISLEPVRCMTCGKVLREKYFDTMEEYVGKRIETNDLLTKLYKELVIMMKDEYQKTQDLSYAMKNLNLSKYYESVKNKSPKYVMEIIENVILKLDVEMQDLLRKGKELDEVLEVLQLDDILLDKWKKLKSYKYKTEDVFEKLEIKRPCCRQTISFRPKMAIPSSFGPITGYDEPESFVEEIVEVEPEPLDKASKLRSLLLKSKQKTKDPKMKKVVKYLGI